MFRGTQGTSGGFGVRGGAVTQSVDPRRVFPKRPHFWGPETVTAVRVRHGGGVEGRGEGWEVGGAAAVEVQ